MDTFMLEHLLKEKRDINNPLKDYSITHLQNIACSSVSDQQADKSADLDDFVRMVEKIITKSGEGKKLGIEFVPDEGSRKYADQSFEIKHPYSVNHYRAKIMVQCLSKFFHLVELN